MRREDPFTFKGMVALFFMCLAFLVYYLLNGIIGQPYLDFITFTLIVIAIFFEAAIILEIMRLSWGKNMIITFSSIDSDQIKSVISSIEDTKLKCKIIAETTHILVIDVKKSHRKNTQAIALAVSELSRHSNIPLIYEEKESKTINDKMERIEIESWLIRNGHVTPMSLESLENAFISADKSFLLDERQ